MNDISLPTATLMRIVRDQLSQGNLLNRDAKSDIGKACAIFTIYLSSTASDIAKEHNRSTILPRDIYEALREVDLGEFIPVLENNLALYKSASNKKDVAMDVSDGEGANEAQ